MINYNMLNKAPIWHKKSQHKMIELKILRCWRKQEPGQTCRVLLKFTKIAQMLPEMLSKHQVLNTKQLEISKFIITNPANHKDKTVTHLCSSMK